MSITLTYTTSEGEEEQVEFEKDVMIIELKKKRIVNIDLSPLSSCTNLHSLNLEDNHLQNIDLSPLSSCTNLHSLNLYDNHLQNIDLSPLSSCIDLLSLDLAHNDLQNIDLTPLSFCTNLQTLFLNHNQFQLADMTPIFEAKRMSSDDPKMSSWLRPSWRKQNSIYSVPVQRYPWSFLYKIIERFENDFRIHHDILAALDLADYGFIDRDLTDILLAIAPETTTEDVREILIKFLVKEIVAAVDRGGPTTGLNLESLVTKHGEIAVRAQRILEHRKKETEKVTIRFDGFEVNLGELWLTAYGYDVLNAMNMGFTTGTNGMEQIKTAFSKLDLDLKGDETARSGVQMSNELKECIWWIAENRGKWWGEIKESSKTPHANRP